MARFAVDGAMLAGQGKIGSIVVERAAGQAIQGSVAPGRRRMAGGAVRPEFSGMGGRLRMATDARSRQATIRACLMARVTVERTMPAGQCEGCAIVIEELQVRQGSIGAAMLQMAGATIGTGGKPTMQRFACQDLPLHVDVALETAVGHGHAAPGRSMASGTVARQVRVRPHPAEGAPRMILLIQGSWAEHAPAGEDQRGDRRGHRDAVAKAPEV
jgi:hypothetical protein